MRWTEDGWLRMADGGNLAQVEVQESDLSEWPLPPMPAYDDFDEAVLKNIYYAPRIMPQTFTDMKSRKSYVRIQGQESASSLNKVSFLARKLTSVYACVTTKMEFHPEVYQHSAGLILYYDNMKYVYLQKTYSESHGCGVLTIVHLENGIRHEQEERQIPLKERPLYLRLYLHGRELWFEWSYNGEDYQRIGGVYDTTKFSDEYCKYGEFTGTMTGLICCDRMRHQQYADFDFFEYDADETRGVNERVDFERDACGERMCVL